MKFSPRKVIAAAGDRLDAGEAAEQRGLAGAVGADDGDDLAGVDREVDAVQHLDAAVAGAQALDVKHGRPPVRRAEVGLDDLGVAADDRGLALGDLLAVVEDDDVVRDAHDHLHVVLHEEDGGAGGGDLGDQVVDLLGLDGVAAGGRLVEEEDAGLERQRAGDLQALERAVGERARLLLGGVAEADAVEEAARLGLGRARRGASSTGRWRRSARSGPFSCRWKPAMAFSSTVMVWKICRFWKVRLRPRRARRKGSKPVTSWPSSFTLRPRGCRRPRSC